MHMRRDFEVFATLFAEFIRQDNNYSIPSVHRDVVYRPVSDTQPPFKEFCSLRGLPLCIRSSINLPMLCRRCNVSYREFCAVETEPVSGARESQTNLLTGDALRSVPCSIISLSSSRLHAVLLCSLRLALTLPLMKALHNACL